MFRSHIWKHNASVGRTADECVSWTHEHTKSFLSQFKPPVPGRWGACCTGQLVSDLHRAAVLASLPVCAAVGNMYLLKPEHVQNVMFSDEFSSAYCSWIVGWKVENAGATAATSGGGSISPSLETGLSWLEAISVQRDVKRRASGKPTCP